MLIYTKLKPFTGIVKVYQVTGNFYDPLLDVKLSSVGLMMKHLSCLCNDNHCQHFSIENFLHELKQKPLEDV